MNSISSLSVEERKELSKKLSSCQFLYFVGIGGSGMYGCARLAADLGFLVTGTDVKESKNTERLRRVGIPVVIGEKKLPEKIDAVVYSLAISQDDPLLVEARKRGILLIDRSLFLAVLSDRYETRVAIAGSHGKSSTVGMCAEILSVSDLSPTVIVGADLSMEEGGYRRGGGSIILLEACEYRDAFLSLSPTHAAVLNAEWEHTDYFQSLEDVKESFCRFLNAESVAFNLAGRSTGFSSRCIVPSENGVHAKELCLKKGCASFLLYEGEERRGEVTLLVPGKHQHENALAAYALSRSLGVSPENCILGLNRYKGIAERMERAGTLFGAPLYLDYAHHPTELRATLACAREMAERVVCLFEPHTFSRLYAFYEEFKELLSLPDKAAVLPVYPAREVNIYGVSSERLATDIGISFVENFRAGADFLKENAKEGSILLLVGAGRIREVLSFMG